MRAVQGRVDWEQPLQGGWVPTSGLRNRVGYRRDFIFRWSIPLFCFPALKMKGSVALVASLLAASTVTLTSSSSGYREVRRNPISAAEVNFPYLLYNYTTFENQIHIFSLQIAIVSLKLQGHSYNSRFSWDESSQRRASVSNNEKFVPKFDGLRFIETLVTAHRWSHRRSNS